MLDSAVEDVPRLGVHGVSDDSLRIRETKQTITLETIGLHDQHSHTGARCTLTSQPLELVGFLAQGAKDLQMTNLVGGASLTFPFHEQERPGKQGCADKGLVCKERVISALMCSTSQCTPSIEIPFGAICDNFDHVFICR